ncbi:MAG: amidase [Deltaproteobacteria bacterium]|nr:amidase [Deltaproteobacteria bacterium]
MKSSSLAEKNLDRLNELAEGFRTGKRSVRDYLGMIKTRFDEREPHVKAFLPEQTDRFERLQQEVENLESRYQEPGSRPPLYGIPVGVKDIFHVEGFPTCAGSRLPPEVLRGPEAASVSILKSAGAMVLGKTVTTEFAYFASGPTRNPHNPDHTPGGSSSGSAAAVAAGLCPLALGTQTIGSILRPASYCGVVGFKPSYGRISVEGVIPLALSVDHVGFFAADAESAVLAASVLCEGWSQRSELSRPVFGVPEGLYLKKTSEQGLNHFRQACSRLSKAGFRIRSVDMFEDFEDIARRHKTLVAAEAAQFHREWFRTYSGLYHEKTAELIRMGQNVDQDDLEACRASREKMRGEVMSVMDRYGLSAFLAPAAVGPAPPGIEYTGDPVMNLPWTHAGLPAMSLPSGITSEGLPVGLQVIGRWMDDETLLGLAQQIEGFISN